MIIIFQVPKLRFAFLAELSTTVWQKEKVASLGEGVVLSDAALMLKAWATSESAIEDYARVATSHIASDHSGGVAERLAKVRFSSRSFLSEYLSLI